jgi:hypothetical protein
MRDVVKAAALIFAVIVVKRLIDGKPCAPRSAR